MVDYLLSTEYDFLVCASEADKLSARPRGVTAP